MPSTAVRSAYRTGSAGEERERLILDHLPQVRWIAHRFHDMLQESVSIDDLISIGIIGLINAVDNFDPSFNTKLKTYAEHKIRGAILDSLRGQSGIPEHRRHRLRQIETAIHALEQRLQRTPDEEEIAVEIGIRLDEYHEWLNSVRGVSVSSLDAGPDTDDGSVLANVIADQQSPTPSELLERAELERIVALAIERMPKIERTILSLHYEQELSLREIAQTMNLHHTRVSQLKAQAILRLRSNLGRRWPAGRKTAF